VAFGYHPKVAGFMDWLGQPERIVPVQAPAPRAWLDTAEAVLATSLAERNDMLARRDEGRRQVERYGALAAALLDGETRQGATPGGI